LLRCVNVCGCTRPDVCATVYTPMRGATVVCAGEVVEFDPETEPEAEFCYFGLQCSQGSESSDGCDVITRQCQCMNMHWVSASVDGNEFSSIQYSDAENCVFVDLKDAVGAGSILRLFWSLEIDELNVLPPSSILNGVQAFHQSFEKKARSQNLMYFLSHTWLDTVCGGDKTLEQKAVNLINSPECSIEMEILLSNSTGKQYTSQNPSSSTGDTLWLFIFLGCVAFVVLYTTVLFNPGAFYGSSITKSKKKN